MPLHYKIIEIFEIRCGMTCTLSNRDQRTLKRALAFSQQHNPRNHRLLCPDLETGRKNAAGDTYLSNKVFVMKHICFIKRGKKKVNNCCTFSTYYQTTREHDKLHTMINISFGFPCLGSTKRK